MATRSAKSTRTTRTAWTRTRRVLSAALVGSVTAGHSGTGRRAGRPVRGDPAAGAGQPADCEGAVEAGSRVRTRDVRAFRTVCRVSRRKAGVGDGQDGASAGAGPLLGTRQRRAGTPPERHRGDRAAPASRRAGRHGVAVASGWHSRRIVHDPAPRFPRPNASLAETKELLGVNFVAVKMLTRTCRPTYGSRA